LAGQLRRRGYLVVRARSQGKRDDRRSGTSSCRLLHRRIRRLDKQASSPFSTPLFQTIDTPAARRWTRRFGVLTEVLSREPNRCPSRDVARSVQFGRGMLGMRSGAAHSSPGQGKAIQGMAARPVGQGGGVARGRHRATSSHADVSRLPASPTLDDETDRRRTVPPLVAPLWGRRARFGVRSRGSDTLRIVV
jgi:hypothetical protein